MNREEYTVLQDVLEMTRAMGGFFVSLNAMNFDTDLVSLHANDNGDITVHMFNSDHKWIKIAQINHWNIDTVQVRNYAIANCDNGLVYQYNLDTVISDRDRKSLEHWKVVLAGC